MKNEIKTRNLKTFFDTDYKEYALYTLSSRSIPSLVDGLKPSGRKILHAALQTLNEHSSQKVTKLVGNVYSYSNYHHGNASLEKTIISLGSGYKDNCTPLQIMGANATLLEPTSAAARYLEVKLSSNAKHYNKDSEILEYVYDGDSKGEPKYFLPLIPMAITKRDSGIALGYGYKNAMSFTLSSIIDVCLCRLENKRVRNKLVPFVDEFEGVYEQLNDGRYKTSSKYEIKGNKIIVVGMPISETYISFEKNLNKLLDKDVITNYTNESEDDKTKYVINCNKSTIEKLQNKGKLESTFKLSTTHENPNLTMVLPNNKIHVFENYDELINTFVDFRLSVYNKSKANKIKTIDAEIDKLTDLSTFIEYVISGKVKINKRPIKDIKADLTKLKLTENGLKLPISKLTKEEYETIISKITEYRNELQIVKDTDIKDMYVNDLKIMKKDVKKFSK